MPFAQTIGHRKYILVPVVQAVIASVDICVGVYVYTLKGEYKGFWPVENMMGDIYLNVMEYVDRTASSDIPHKIRIKSRDDLLRR